MKTIYFLRTRFDDSEPWSEPEPFRSRKARDNAASQARIIGGIRTHSYEERMKKEAAEELLANA